MNALNTRNIKLLLGSANLQKRLATSLKARASTSYWIVPGHWDSSSSKKEIGMVRDKVISVFRDYDVTSEKTAVISELEREFNIEISDRDAKDIRDVSQAASKVFAIKFRNLIGIE